MDTPPRKDDALRCPGRPERLPRARRDLGQAGAV